MRINEGVKGSMGRTTGKVGDTPVYSLVIDPSVTACLQRGASIMIGSLKVADIPPVLLTAGIFDKIWAAFIRKGSPLTREESEAFCV